MQQRRVRLGDILDDYCPRERRVTNHAVVAMVEDDVKQTRCTTCDAEHEYKHAKVPITRRKKPTGSPAGTLVDPGAAEPSLLIVEEEESTTIVEESLEAAPEGEAAADPEDTADPEEGPEDQWVHRPLIRATLPRPEGQVPERKAPEFTIRQTGGRFDGQHNGNRPRGNKPTRHGQAQGHGHSSGQSRFGGPRQGSGQAPRHGSGQHPGNSERHGNRQGPPSGQRGPTGHGGGQRPGHGRGPKRGR